MTEIQLDYELMASTSQLLIAHADDLEAAALLIDTKVNVIGLASATAVARNFQTKVATLIGTIEAEVEVLATNVQGSATSHQDQDQTASRGLGKYERPTDGTRGHGVLAHG